MQAIGAPWQPSQAIADRDDPRPRTGCAGLVTCNSSRCATLVAMVQAADLRKCNNGACGGWLYGPRVWTILCQREMRPASVVILKVCREHSAQVALVEDDDVIETFAADRADDAFDVGILPWRSRRGDDLLDRHRLDTIGEGLPIRSVAVSQQKARRGVPGEGLSDLARQPELGRVLRDFEMDDCSSLMAEDDQGVEKLKSCSHDNEHVDGGGVMHVIVQKRAPGWGRDFGPPWKISANRGLAHVDPELEQLAVDAGRAPKRVCGVEVPEAP
jgi:hypothetical protein